MDDTRISRGYGSGYVKADGTICMDRCFSCSALNYAPAVSSGVCFHCGFIPGKFEKENVVRLVLTNVKRSCPKCAGFGKFSDEEPRHMTQCLICKSIHPEALGITSSFRFTYLAD